MVFAPHSRNVPPRRGMLLLLVLGILALFLVVGAVGVLISIRARESARAFAAASTRQAAFQSVARAQLDEALLRLIRGSNPAGVVTENLLEDKYGTSGTCSVTAITGAGTPYLTVTVSGTDTTNPYVVAGRLITFDPDPRDPTGPTSYRILRPGSAANTLLVANVKPTTPLPLPSVFPCNAVINGREFSGTPGTDRNEPYDAFDDRNPFLTQPVLQNSTIDSIARPAFGGNCTVDNDGDGVPDGAWLTNALPAQGAPGGGLLTFDVSYLVLDLDGRINLNAHGSFDRAVSPRTTAEYPNDPATMPVGLGYGPADVDAVAIVGGQAAGSTTNRWAILLQGANVTRNALASSAVQWRPTPPVDGASQPGRYGLGSGAQPGGSTVTGTNPLSADFWLRAGNSPTDLKSRLQQYTVTTGGTPSLRFVRPGPAWGYPDTDDILGTGSGAHPYRMRLDTDAPRAAGAGADDAPYTVGELERILRPFDADAATLAPRLAAILDDYAERSRMTATTDSWDTPAITGAAATTIVNADATYDPYAVHSPEVVAGLRFNINRALESATDRQDYFKQLYTLLRLQAPTPPTGFTAAQWSAALAQWAANVVEFRDADSIMTWFPYDPAPFDGSWTPGSTGVWGAERPELLIRMSSGSSKVVSTFPPNYSHTATVTLCRPWNAQVVTGAGATPGGAAERIDPCLGDAATNTLNPRATQTSGTYPVWRIAYVSAGEPLASRLATSATAVGTNTELALSSTITGNSSSSTALRVRLLRLADPTRPFNATSTGSDKNDYVIVHSTSRDFNQAPTVWLHWPNRDLVSHGELLAVQSGSTTSLADAMFDASKGDSIARTVPAILEATIVPSRFAGAAVSVTNAPTVLAGTGYENLKYGHFSRWREPGRVNVNTILANTGNTPAALDNAVWTAIVGLAGTENPVTAGGAYAPITADRDLLVSGTDARFPRAGAEAGTAFLRRSSAIRLANVATIRSHVFAVWITLRINDSSKPGAPQYARAFAIVDRSIPAGYQPGRTLNVRDTIRLQRFLP